ncbi:MAG: hypothetical protein COA43_05865 [Robiginitomaculum sp.]|nr:MAG: hypothetical protein COA43_05865 [Robiginitomaculum sp.]
MRKFHYIRGILFVLITTLYFQPSVFGFKPIEAFAAAEKVKKVKPPKAKRRPNLSYRPTVSRINVKYYGRLGVFQLRDKRTMVFYGGEDKYFSEPVLKTLSNTLYLELKSGRAFESVKKIPQAPSAKMSRKDILAIAQKYELDYVFIADLTAFNLLREKMVKKKKGLDFKINIRFGVMGQLIDVKTGAVLWAEPIIREDGTLNTDKRVSAEDYGEGARTAVQNGFDDMKNSIRQIGLEVRK